jgi:hypothetical protein
MPAFDLGYSQACQTRATRHDSRRYLGMDISLYGRVLWRFRWLVAFGLLLATVLAVLSVAKVSQTGLTYRKPELWQSSSTVLLTQKGFPWGYSSLPPSQQGSSQFGGPSWLAGLTELYAQFANSDQVRAQMLRDGASPTWKLTAAPVIPSGSSSALPVVQLVGLAFSPKDAVRATLVGRSAFMQYVKGQQGLAAIPNSDRVDLQVLQNTTPPIVIQPRKKTLPIVIFVAVMTATIGLAFILENARPRVTPVTTLPAPESVDHGLVRSRAEG